MIFMVGQGFAVFAELLDGEGSREEVKEVVDPVNGEHVETPIGNYLSRRLSSGSAKLVGSTCTGHCGATDFRIGVLHISGSEFVGSEIHYKWSRNRPQKTEARYVFFAKTPEDLEGLVRRVKFEANSLVTDYQI